MMKPCKNCGIEKINSWTYCGVCAPDKRSYERLKRYGMSAPEFREAYNSQRGRCAICSKKFLKDKVEVNKICIDHEHESGQNRGLLCHQCNIMLGMVGEDIEILQAAIHYLEFWSR